MNNIGKINSRLPPNSSDFSELFGFFWTHGIGNPLNKRGDPQGWTDITLEQALETSGYHIDRRSIQNWYNGTHTPSVPHLHALSKIAANGDENIRAAWADKLIFARQQTLEAKRKTKKSQSAPITHVHQERIPDVPTTSLSKYRAFLFGVFATLLIGIVSYFAFSYSSKTVPDIQVTNLKFCDKATFDADTETCVSNVTHFKNGIKLIYVSFQLMGAPNGHPFERRWYLQGKEFLRKDGFYDDAWQGYTWLLHEDGFEAGKYDLRIIIDGKVTTTSFYIGDVLNRPYKYPKIEIK